MGFNDLNGWPSSGVDHVRIWDRYGSHVHLLTARNASLSLIIYVHCCFSGNAWSQIHLGVDQVGVFAASKLYTFLFWCHLIVS